MPESKKSPWSWTPPPLPSTHEIFCQSSVQNDRVWHRLPWATESAYASFNFASPGYGDVIISCQLTSTNYKIDNGTVKQAVRLLRYDHPAIAAKWACPKPGGASNSAEKRLAYEVPGSEGDVDVWLSDVITDRSDALGEANGDVDAAIALVRHDLGKAGTGPPTTFFEAHFVPSSSGGPACGIVLRLGHAVFDATGSFQILDSLIERIAQILRSGGHKKLNWGDEVVRLAEPFPDIAKVPWSLDSMKSREDRFMLDKLAETVKVGENMPGVRFAHPADSLILGTGFITRTMLADSVQALRSVARNHGCTLSSIFESASLLSLLRINYVRRMPSINTGYMNPVDLRARHLRADTDPRNKAHWRAANSIGFAAYIVRDLQRFVHPGDICLGPEQLLQDLWVLAKETQAQVEENREVMDRAAFWVHEFLEAALAALGVEGGPKVSAKPAVGSLGVVDQHLSQRVAVNERDFLVVSQPKLAVRHPVLTCHIYTWSGTLYIDFSFTEGYYGTLDEQLGAAKEGLADRASLLAFIDEFMGILQLVVDSAP
ncbi:hypothetical protein GLOTRDRAFT_121921 [Gloeophyllum trabeum ATCC 11539]|uniref:CoA-dependent acyltransferase n=1 Tax=Gloeophyllum trabeum (strain ATCC 11539 / FP-39264 / Madison 617) TaxID=670483 RepID=S7RIB0_GLOTA|nr:uncharacterized protein GLOTRDRAFT_121921 [Gloeophyllum trabeum ATCC 11539]EPQ54020.1 hypothetical protein GLOTRDRAFT_121921 [Gloeophyllum trabeum ATCC 11539]